MIGDGFKPYHHETDGMGSLIGGCHADIVNTQHSLRAKVIYAAKTLEVSSLLSKLILLLFRYYWN